MFKSAVEKWQKILQSNERHLVSLASNGAQHVFVHICAFAHMLCFMRSDTYMLESMHICMLVHLKCAVSGAFMHLYFYVLCAVCNCPVPQNQGEMKPKYCILNYHLHIAYIA